MTIRLSGVSNEKSSGGKDPLPEGRYDFIVSKVELGKSPTKKTPQLSVWTKVVGGPKNGKTRIMNFYLTEKSLWKLQEFLLAVGYDKARKDVEPEELAADLNSADLVFSAFASPNGEFNEYNGFGKASSEALKASGNKGTESASDLDDLPF